MNINLFQFLAHDKIPCKSKTAIVFYMQSNAMQNKYNQYSVYCFSKFHPKQLYSFILISPQENGKTSSLRSGHCC